MATVFYQKTLGCLLGGLIGDAIGTPTEGMDYKDIEEKLGWVDDFDCDGTDDTVIKTLLAEALIRTGGQATYDDWAQEWLNRWDAIFGEKVGKFFPSVLHTAFKLRRHCVPRMAALGNMPSSSSAMGIAPVGIVNACNPRQAAAQAYSVAGLIHIHDVGFCQDGAAAVAAAIAQAFCDGTTVDEIVSAAYDVVVPASGAEMRELIEKALDVAKRAGDFKAFRAAIYEQEGTFFRRIICDSRETVPIALALFSLSDGEVEKAVIYGANFGRDSDTIATMCGAIAGAYRGVEGIKEDWVERARDVTSIDQHDLANRLVATAIAKYKSEYGPRERFASLAALHGTD